MDLRELLLRAHDVVNDLARAVENQGFGMKEVEEAVFDQERNLRFRNRFGGETVRARRCYIGAHN